MAKREECIEALERVVRQLTWLGRKSLTQELSYYGVTVPQFYALLSLEKHGRAYPMKELAQATEQALPTMTGIIDRLVRMGLVERRRKESDRRVVLVRLTRRGEQLLKEVKARRRQSFYKALAKFDDEKLDQLLSLLEALPLAFSWEGETSEKERVKKRQ